MAHDRKLTVAGLNIVTHPHSTQGYVNLFKSAFQLKKSVALRTTQRVMIGEMRPIRSGESLINGIFGRIYRFDQIDQKAPWFNVVTNEIASDEEVAAISIPEELKPNLAMFDFVFFPKNHKFYFVSHKTGQDLSASSLKKLFDNLFSSTTITQQFGTVEITVLPDRSELTKILSLYRLAKLSIDLTRPNPDDNEDDEREIYRRMENQGIRKLHQVLTADRTESITPDEQTKLLAKVAADNGKVSAVGYTQAGERVEASTVKKPWSEQIVYNPDSQEESEALISFSSNL